jgi:hypothetical protein
LAVLDEVRLVKVHQQFDAVELSDPAGELHRQLPVLDRAIAPGARIAIACGSRGIDRLPLIVKELAVYIRGKGGHAFIVPAMGSHGGATAEGQREVLRLNGITPDSVGASVQACMDVVELPRRGLAHRIFMDRLAYESDGVILINRIKAHTDFHGRYESGLVKMSVVGLGKLEGATAVHDFGVEGLRDMVAPAAEQILATGRILAGIALVENAFHKTRALRVLPAGDILREEPALLQLSKEGMAALPCRAIDVLILDRMGKNISGVGIDPNITGRIGVAGQSDPEGAQVTSMVVCDLTSESHGNAIGVGLADVITERLHQKIDWADTYRNVITSSFLERGKMPIVAASDRAAFDVALRSCGHIPPGRERIVRIHDTLRLDICYVSAAIAEELRGSRISVEDTAIPMFDSSGTLTEFK